jgi:capsule polysaccharide export protein KpsC/LpsZ
MNPREKANNLVNRYYYTLPNNGELNSGINSCESRYKEAIQCALIAVDEILKCHIWKYNSIEPYKYWQEVKQWIQKIDDKEPGAQWTIEDMKKTITINK